MDVLKLVVTEERFPPHDDTHGTPDPMVRRTVAIGLEKGMANFEQTDYGHPGRFNSWEPRGIDATVQPRTPALIALCDAITPLLS